MKNRLRIEVPREKIVQFCKENHVRKLCFFGSVLRGDFGPESDVDILVEFEPGKGPGFLGLSHMERELSEILGRRRIDLRTPHELSRYFRDDVLSSAEVQYAEG